MPTTLLKPHDASQDSIIGTIHLNVKMGTCSLEQPRALESGLGIPPQTFPSSFFFSPLKAASKHPQTLGPDEYVALIF